MEEIRNQITRIIKEIDDTTALFYQQKTTEGYKQLDNTLAQITQGIDTIIEYKQVNSLVSIKESQLNQYLMEALKAMENHDTVLLSDILQYDIKDVFSSVLDAIK